MQFDAFYPEPEATDFGPKANDSDGEKKRVCQCRSYRHDCKAATPGLTLGLGKSPP
jgi:hypothetical protein